MNGGITLAALRQCQHASKVISPFIILAVFDVLFRRYKLLINYSFFYIYMYYNAEFVCFRSIGTEIRPKNLTPCVPPFKVIQCHRN